jgi:hypothetical protein
MAGGKEAGGKIKNKTSRLSKQKKLPLSSF